MEVMQKYLPLPYEGKSLYILMGGDVNIQASSEIAVEK